MAQQISVELNLIDHITKNMEAINRRMDSHFKDMERGAARTSRATSDNTQMVHGMRGAYGLLAGVLGGALVRSFLSVNAEMENNVVSFQVLLGSVGAAQARMKEYADFAAKTPFELPEIAKAGRVLQTFGGDLLATGKNLTLVGDIASGTNTSFENTAMWIGRMYDALQSGRPWGEAAMRLQEMGALSGEARARLESLQKQGVEGTVIFEKFKEEVSQFGGMMEAQSKTWSGQWSTFVDNIKSSMRAFGEGGVFDAFKGVLEDINGWFSTNQKTVESWASNVGRYFVAFGQVAQGVLVGAMSAVVGIVNIVVIQPIVTALKAVSVLVETFLGSLSASLGMLPERFVPGGWIEGLDGARLAVEGFRKSVVGFGDESNMVVKGGFLESWDLLTKKVEAANRAAVGGDSKARKPKVPGLPDPKEAAKISEEVAKATSAALDAAQAGYDRSFDMVKAAEAAIDGVKEEYAKAEVERLTAMALAKKSFEGSMATDGSLSEYEVKTAQAQIHYDALRNMAREAYTDEVQLKDALADIDAKHQAAKRRAALEQLQETSAGMTQNMTVIVGQYKSFAGVFRKFAHFQNAIDTYAGATAAYKSAATIPLVGYILAPIAAATAVAAGLANGSRINSQGFRSGGYTGDGAPSDAAGVVHKREFVFDEAATSRYGRGNLEAMRSGRMPMGGGTTINAPNISLGGIVVQVAAGTDARGIGQAVLEPVDQRLRRVVDDIEEAQSRRMFRQGALA